jgi:hypothetical protein
LPGIAKADRKAVEGAGAHQREHVAPLRHLGHDAAAHEQAARVLVDALPDTDRCGGVVLEEHADAAGPALPDAFPERAGQDDVTAHVLAVEQARIALERALHVDALQVECPKFDLVHAPYRRSKCFAHLVSLGDMELLGIFPPEADHASSSPAVPFNAP